jgi:hypothetical protein
MNYPYMPAEVASQSWQVACYAVTLVMALMSWLSLGR